ncbi:hypothetical protein D3C79_1070440 [compost metagenome]
MRPVAEEMFTVQEINFAVGIASLDQIMNELRFVVCLTQCFDVIDKGKAIQPTEVDH